MAIIHVELVAEFRDDDAVLVAMDGAGVTTLLSALHDADARGTSQLELDGVTHQFVIQAGSAELELAGHRVEWRLDHTKVVELVEDLTTLSNHDCPGHHYVDIATPARTLVLSRDEYLTS